MKHELINNKKWSSFKSGIVILIVFFLFFIITLNLIPQLPSKTRLVVNIVVISAHSLLIFLVYLVNRKFLKRINFDYTTSSIQYSIITSRKNRKLSFIDIKEIKIIKSYGFRNKTEGFRSRNFVLKIKDRSQPLIFEIKNETNFILANAILEKLNNE